MILPAPPTSSAAAASSEGALPFDQDATTSAASAAASPFARLLAELAPRGETDPSAGATEELAEELLPEPASEEASQDGDVSAWLVGAAPLAEPLATRIPASLAELPREQSPVVSDTSVLDTTLVDANPSPLPADATHGRSDPGNRASAEVAETASLQASLPLAEPVAVAAEALPAASLSLPLAANPVAEGLVAPLRTTASSNAPRLPGAVEAQAEPIEAGDSTELAQRSGPLEPAVEDASPRAASASESPRVVDAGSDGSRSSRSRETGRSGEPTLAAPNEASSLRDAPRFEAPLASAALPVLDSNSAATPNSVALSPGMASASSQAPIGMAAPVAGHAQPAAQAAAVEAISQRVEVLAEQGGGVARIRLHPAELGQIELSVRVRGNSVEISMLVENGVVQAMAHGARDRLADNLAARDLQMQNFEVGSFDSRSSDSSARDAAAWMGGRRQSSQGGPNGAFGRGGTGTESVDIPELRRGARAGTRVVDLRV